MRGSEEKSLLLRQDGMCGMLCYEARRESGTSSREGGAIEHSVYVLLDAFCLSRLAPGALITGGAARKSSWAASGSAGAYGSGPCSR